MIYFLDSNIFLRVLVREDRQTFADCSSLLGLVKSGECKACTSTLVLAEVHWTLLSFYGFPKRRALLASKSILNLRGLKIKDGINHSRAIELYEKYPIKFIDALLASSPQVSSKKMAIVSYDRDFDKVDVLRFEPDQVLQQLGDAS